MRMWMIQPDLICSKHLRGEHVESHMFEGTIRKKIQLNGYVDSNALELKSLKKRHDDIVNCLIDKYNMNHNTPSTANDLNYDYLPDKVINSQVDILKSYYHLLNTSMKSGKGCPDCRKLLFDKYMTNYDDKKSTTSMLLYNDIIHICVDNYYFNVYCDNGLIVNNFLIYACNNYSDCMIENIIYDNQNILLLYNNKLTYKIESLNNINSYIESILPNHLLEQYKSYVYNY